MKTECVWQGKSNFVTNINGFKVQMDAKKPFGDEQAPSPKELVLGALCGCTGMDVVNFLKKYKQVPDKFTITAEATMAPTHPLEFKEISLKYEISGANDQERLAEAVRL